MMTSPVKLWRRQKYIPGILGREGKVVSWTIVRTPPSGYKQFAPYICALVEFKNGERITGQIVDKKFLGENSIGRPEIKIGDNVVAVLRKIREPDSEGVIPYGIKFKVCG